MNKYLIGALFFFGIYCTGDAQVVKCIDPSKVAFTAKLTSVKSIDQGVYLTVKTSITNNSSDTLRYLSMSCSWANYYIIDQRALHLPTPQCDRDTALLITIPPHKQKEAVLGLISLLTAKQLHNSKFKVGFKFVQACDTNKASKELRKSKNVIWSNNLIIK